LPKLVFEGTVFSGKGEGKKFIELPWVKRQIQEKLHFTPYPGTLNIHLTSQSIANKEALEEAEGMEVEPQAGYCQGVLFKAHIDGLEGGVVIPKVPSYPIDVLEIIAPVCLREKFGLRDGSLVAVSVDL
jgi:riboflavin kinase